MSELTGESLLLSIIIPCFNEAQGIREAACIVDSYLRKRLGVGNYEIILIDDGSTDETRAVISHLARELDAINPIYFDTNRGRGAAVVAGMREAHGRNIICLDADLSYDVEHVGEILNRFEAHPKLDVVVVSPYMRGGSVRGVPFGRLVLSRCANLILSGVFSNGLSTVTSVVRGYRASAVKNLPLFETSKELHLEILRKLTVCGAVIEEIPGRLHWKTTRGKPRRKINWNIVDSAKRHLLYGFLIKPTRIFRAITVLLFVIGTDELLMISYECVKHFHYVEGFWQSLWLSLSHVYGNSPHSFVIGGIALTLGAQAFTLLAILQVLKLQQEETLRHVVAVLEQVDRGRIDLGH